MHNNEIQEKYMIHLALYTIPYIHKTGGTLTNAFTIYSTLSFSVITEYIDLPYVLWFDMFLPQDHNFLGLKTQFLFMFFQMMLPVTSRVNRVPRRPFWVDPVFPMVWLPPETWSVISAKVQLPLEVHMGTMKSHLSEKSPFPETMKIKPINVILVLSIGLQILP